MSFKSVKKVLSYVVSFLLTLWEFFKFFNTGHPWKKNSLGKGITQIHTQNTTINIFKNICTFFLLLCYLFVISFHRLCNFLKKAYHIYFIFEEYVKEIIWSTYFYAIWTWPIVWNVIQRLTFTDRSLRLELCKKFFK